MIVVEKIAKYKIAVRNETDTVNSASYQEVVTALETRKVAIERLLNNHEAAEAEVPAVTVPWERKDCGSISITKKQNTNKERNNNINSNSYKVN
jgi:hypothetical protein